MHSTDGFKLPEFRLTFIFDSDRMDVVPAVALAKEGIEIL
jgi:hypothetical protein